MSETKKVGIVKQGPDTTTYRGRVYISPCDRGVSLLDATYDEMYGSGFKSELSIEDLFRSIHRGDEARDC